MTKPSLPATSSLKPARSAGASSGSASRQASGRKPATRLTPPIVVRGSRSEAIARTMLVVGSPSVASNSRYACAAVPRAKMPPCGLRVAAMWAPYAKRRTNASVVRPKREPRPDQTGRGLGRSRSAASRRRRRTGSRRRARRTRHRRLQDGRGETAGEVEEEVTKTAEGVLDVFPKHGEEQHVAEDVIPASVKEHRRDPADPPRLGTVAAAVDGARIERCVVDGHPEVW